MLPWPKETSSGVLPSRCFGWQTEFFHSSAKGSFPSLASEKNMSLAQQKKRETEELIRSAVSSQLALFLFHFSETVSVGGLEGGETRTSTKTF